MTITRSKLCEMIEVSVLRPDASMSDIEEMCRVAKEYGFRAVYALPAYIPQIKRLLEGTNIRIGAPIGFPFGGVLTDVKVFETLKCLELGADEFDMVINIGALRSGKHDLVYEDIKRVVEAAQKHVVKVILEIPYLTREEIVEGCKLAEDAGANFVKTSTGFAGYNPKVDDVILMRSAISSSE